MSAPARRPAEPRDSIEPCNADESRIHFTASRRFLAKLEKARAVLSRSHPKATFEEIFEAGLDLVLAADAKKKGLTTRPQKNPRPTTDPDHVPAEVRRAVWERDRGCCAWPLESGGVCGSTHRLQLDHVVPRAQGGPSTIDNVRVTCEFHNILAARRSLGDAVMDRYTSVAAPGATAARLP